MSTLNSKTNESKILIYQFTDKLNLKNPNKNMALANLSIYYTWKNIKSEYNNNKFKMLRVKYVKGYSFLSFVRKFGDKTGTDAAKTASKRVLQKTAEATGDLIGNKIADKITSVGK